MIQMKTDTLKSRLIEAGYPESDMFHHETDLYVYDTPLTREVVKKYCIDQGWDRLSKTLDRTDIDELVIKTFTDNITGKRMLDLAFQWYDNTGE